MDRVKYFYFTSVIWTIFVLSLLIVFFYKCLENNSLDFTVKSTCSERTATREQCLCSQEFCVNKCCDWGVEPVLISSTSFIFECKFSANETAQRIMFTKSLQKYYTSATDTEPKITEGHFKIYIDFLTSEATKAQDEPLDFDYYVRLFQNGTAESIVDGRYRNPSEYCLDTFFKTEVFKFFYISSDDNSDNVESVNVLRVVLNSVSVFFFILTLLVYAVLPRLQTLRGKCLMCYFMCMLIAYVGLQYFALRDTNAANYVETCAIMGELSILFPF